MDKTVNHTTIWKIVITGGIPNGRPGNTNLIKVEVI